MQAITDLDINSFAKMFSVAVYVNIDNSYILNFRDKIKISHEILLSPTFKIF